MYNFSQNITHFSHSSKHSLWELAIKYLTLSCLSTLANVVICFSSIQFNHNYTTAWKLGLSTSLFISHIHTPHTIIIPFIPKISEQICVKFQYFIIHYYIQVVFNWRKHETPTVIVDQLIHSFINMIGTIITFIFTNKKKY